MLNNLYAAVQRAGPVFTGHATMSPEGEGFRITMQLANGAFNKNEVGVRVQKTLNSYIRAYLRESGWRVKGAGCRRGYFELFVAASSATSSASQKRSANL